MQHCSMLFNNCLRSSDLNTLLNRAGAGLEIPQDAIMALDVALKHSTADNVLCTAVSRNFFFEGSGTTPISGGAEVSISNFLKCS